MHRKTHTDLTQQPPTVGMRRVQTVHYVCANFHPFTIITDFSASSPPFVSLPISLLLPNCLHPFLPAFLLHLSPTTTTASAYIAANLPRSSFFTILFTPESILPSHPHPLSLPPPTNRDSGDDGGCPEGAAISIGGRSRQFSYRTT